MSAHRKLSFEEALVELEKIVDQMEAGDITLEESIRLYARGAELSKICRERLGEAEAKLLKLGSIESGEGEATEPARGEEEDREEPTPLDLSELGPPLHE